MHQGSASKVNLQMPKKDTTVLGGSGEHFENQVTVSDWLKMHLP